MKIAHLTSTFPPYRGGMGNSVMQFANFTAELGHDIVVLTPEYGRAKQVSGPQLGPGVKVRRLKPLFSYGNAAVCSSVYKYIKNFDIIHLHYPFYGTALLTAIYKRFKPKAFKLVVHYHMDTRAKGIKGLIFFLYKKLFLNFILDSAEEITCASFDYIKHSDAAPAFYEDKIKFSQVPFGVDQDIFHPNGKKSDEPTVVFVGGLDSAHYFKGVDKLINAFAKVNRNNPQTRLKVIGRGNMLPAYRKQAADLHIADKVEFITNADDEKMAEILRRSWALALPSINRNEAFGLVLLEAMACGTAVIAANLPGVRSVFKNGKQGLLVKPGDEEDLYIKLNTLLNNKNKALRYGQAAYRLAKANYTWEKAADKLNEIYHRVKFTPKKRV